MISLYIAHYLTLWWAWCYITRQPLLLAVLGSRFVVASVVHVAIGAS